MVTFLTQKEDGRQTIHTGNVEGRGFNLYHRGSELFVEIVDALGKVQKADFSVEKEKVVREFVATQCGFMDFESYAIAKPNQAMKLSVYAKEVGSYGN